jgi:hypothetical protein
MATIVFQINLATERLSSDQYIQDPTGIQKSFRSTFLPDVLVNNHILKDGNQFTATGDNAQYLKTLYTTGSNPLLTIISNTI